MSEKISNILTEYQITDIINRFRFLERNTVKNISEDTGISESRVRKIIDRFIETKKAKV